MRRIASLAAAAALAGALAAPAAAQEVWGGSITLYDEYGNTYYGDPHQQRLVRHHRRRHLQRLVRHRRARRRLVLHAADHREPVGERTAPNCYAYQPGDVWSPGRDYNE